MQDLSWMKIAYIKKARGKKVDYVLRQVCPMSWDTTIVRAKGLEPPPREGPGPKPGASTNFATPAF